jgi:hypothetical protein
VVCRVVTRELIVSVEEEARRYSAAIAQKYTTVSTGSTVRYAIRR